MRSKAACAGLTRMFISVRECTEGTSRHICPGQVSERELCLFEQLADAVQERVADHAVDHPVIIGERQVHHLAHDDHVLAVQLAHHRALDDLAHAQDRKSTRLNSSHVAISYAVFCLKKKKK